MGDNVVVLTELRDELRREYRGYRIRVIAVYLPSDRSYRARVSLRKGGEPGEADVLRGYSVVAPTQCGALCGGLEIAQTRIDGYFVSIA